MPPESAPRIRDREADRARSRAYYAANRDRLREQMRARAAANREERREYGRTWAAQNRINRRAVYLLRVAKARAQARGMEFTLTLADIQIPDTCPVLGIPIVVTAGRPPAPGAPSLDRIDNDVGYVPGNVRVISFRANALKSNATLEEMRLIVENWTAR